MKNLVILITLLSATALFADNTRDRGTWCGGKSCWASCHQKCMKDGKSCNGKSHKGEKHSRAPWDNSSK